MLYTALSPAIKILESEFGCQFYWCCMEYSRIPLSLLEIYWFGNVESNKTVFLISKPRGHDSRRNIESKHTIARRFLPPLSLLFSGPLLNNFGCWAMCSVGLPSGIESEDQVWITSSRIVSFRRKCWAKALFSNGSSISCKAESAGELLCKSNRESTMLPFKRSKVTTPATALLTRRKQVTKHMHSGKDVCGWFTQLLPFSIYLISLWLNFFCYPRKIPNSLHCWVNKIRLQVVVHDSHSSFHW